MPKKTKRKAPNSTPPSNSLSNKFFQLIGVTLAGIAVAQILFFRSSFRIGLDLELTGEYSEIGQNSLKGAQLAVDQLNANGGILHNGKKYKVELVVENNNSDSQSAANIVTQFKTKKAHAVIGPNNDILANTAASEAEIQQILLLSPSSTDTETTLFKSLVFRTAFTDQIQIQSLVKYANFDLKATRAAIFYDGSNNISQNQANFFRSEFQTWGGQVVAFNALPTEEAGIVAQFNSLKTINPDVIFLPISEDQAVSIFSKATEVGVLSTFLGSDIWDLNEMREKCGEACNEIYVTTHFSTQTDSDLVRRFVTEYQAKFNEEPSGTAALTYDSILLLANAAAQAEDLSAPSLAAAFKKLTEIEGVTGNITFTDYSNDPFKSSQILTIEDGQTKWVKTVYP